MGYRVFLVVAVFLLALLLFPQPAGARPGMGRCMRSAQHANDGAERDVRHIIQGFCHTRNAGISGPAR